MFLFFYIFCIFKSVYFYLSWLNYLFVYLLVFYFAFIQFLQFLIFNKFVCFYIFIRDRRIVQVTPSVVRRPSVPKISNSNFSALGHDRDLGVSRGPPPGTPHDPIAYIYIYILIHLIQLIRSIHLMQLIQLIQINPINPINAN